MANYLPFNSIGHDRVYKAEDWAWYFSTFIGNGVFPNPVMGLQVVANGAMDVAIKAGFGFINGYAFRNQNDCVLTISTGDGSLGRIDRIVLRWDLTNRQMVLDVLQGTPSKDPQPVALTRTADTYELALADIDVTKGMTTISQANITDTRMDPDVCGWVCGTVKQIEFEQIYAQFKAFQEAKKEEINKKIEDYETWETGFKETQENVFSALKTSFSKKMDDFTETEFNKFLSWYTENTTNWTEEVMKWYNILKDQLSGDVAFNLQNQIYSINAILREITDDEIDRIVSGTYEGDDKGGYEPDIYSRITDEEIDNIINKSFSNV